MADPALQLLLDPDSSGRGIQILRRADPDSTNCSYYVQAGANRANNINGNALWVNCLQVDSDATKNTSIRAALGVP
jgi:hypothetical protein